MKKHTVSLLLLAACVGAPAVRPSVDLQPFMRLRADDFPGAKSLLDGLAAPDDDPTPRVGDAALLAVELHDDGAVERQLMLMQVHAVMPREQLLSFTATTTSTPTDGGEPRTERRTWNVHAIQVQLSRHAADGTFLHTSLLQLYEEPLATGWWPSSERAASARDRDMEGTLTMSMQEIASRDPTMQDLLFRIVDRPSLLSIAAHFGVKVVVAWAAPPWPPEIVDVTDSATTVRRSPLALRVNGNTAAWVDLLVAKPRGATMVCGGLFGAIARHGTDADRFVVVRLLATRRGAQRTVR